MMRRIIGDDDDDISSDDDATISPQVAGLHPDWLAVLPEIDEKLLREEILNYGPIIFCIYAKCVSTQFIVVTHA